VWLIEIFRGTISPRNAPPLSNSVLATMTFADIELLVLFVSLFPALAPVVG